MAQYVIPTLQGTDQRVNARETGAVCNNWISYSNNYSVWPPRIEALEKLPGRSRRHKTTPMLCSVSSLLSKLRTNYFGARKLRGSTCVPATSSVERPN